MAYLKSLIIFILLLIYSFCYEKILLHFINNGTFNNLSNEYFNLADTIFYIPILIFFIFFYKNQPINKREINYKRFINILLLVVLFKIIENPITNIKFILENENSLLTAGNSQKYGALYFVLSFINVVLLTSLVEELIFRKVIISFFDKKNILYGCIFSSILFATYHFNISNIYSVKPLISLLLGFLLSLIYTKLGLFYSIVFHSLYNLLWLVLNNNNLIYFKILNWLNFSYEYWVIIFCSLILFFYFLRRLDIGKITYLNK
ncbi:type II CAAX prenyl endopeptidase Rce1 family protein [Chryseobacterium sp.]|uniref:CPBP family glutamic-type intramembrane protease n=1 Tax=Chryseobacterium sp. TaxID=1871047 RepID=UPI0035B4677F